jgi:hypothetical protein
LEMADLPVADMEDLELADFLVSVAKLSELDNCAAVSETGQVYYWFGVQDDLPFSAVPKHPNLPQHLQRLWFYERFP